MFVKSTARGWNQSQVIGMIFVDINWEEDWGDYQDGEEHCAEAHSVGNY